MHDGLDNKYIVNNGGYAQQVVVAAGEIFVEPVVSVASIFVDPALNDLQKQRIVDLTRLHSLPRMDRDDHVQLIALAVHDWTPLSGRMVCFFILVSNNWL